MADAYAASEKAEEELAERAGRETPATEGERTVEENLIADVLLKVLGSTPVWIDRASPTYTRDQLLASSDYSQPQPAEDREWIDAPATGKELI